MIDWTKVITVEDKFAKAKEAKKSEIAQARYNAEIAGVTINGVLIKTDRETQAVLTAACLQAYIDSGYSLNWKTGDGTFVSLPAEQIMAFGTAVRAHVQSCFDHEAELLPLLASAETEAELDAIEWQHKHDKTICVDRGYSHVHFCFGTGYIKQL